MSKVYRDCGVHRHLFPQCDIELEGGDDLDLIRMDILFDESFINDKL